ncbi:hypothetical protein SDJN03_16773, partial [Cucurbita argyrosperma subsp. sororia]
MQIMKGTYLVWVTPKWSSHLPFSLITHKFPPLCSSLSVPTFSLLQLSRKSFILFLSQADKGENLEKEKWIMFTHLEKTISLSRGR